MGPSSAPAVSQARPWSTHLGATGVRIPPHPSEARLTAKFWPGRLQRWDPSPPDPAPLPAPPTCPGSQVPPVLRSLPQHPGG